MIVPAPGRFSITKGSLSALRSSSASKRVKMSVGPPAPNGTIILIGCDGYSCAVHGAAATNDNIAKATSDETRWTVVMGRRSVGKRAETTLCAERRGTLWDPRRVGPGRRGGQIVSVGATLAEVGGGDGFVQGSTTEWKPGDIAGPAGGEIESGSSDP